MARKSRGILDPVPCERCTNVFVFVCDALRWDARPDRVTAMGTTAKTVASGLMTPQAVPSMLTGVHPPRHGVTWFHERLPDDLETVFEIDGVDASFREVEWMSNCPLDTVLNQPPSEELDALEEPFVYVEHDLGGHAPYTDVDGESAAETFRKLSRQPERLRAAYEQHVDRSVDRFERRLEELADRDVLEETLVIFTSDHGEQLGERGGLVGHGYPPTPELVYVPTTFIHPALETRTVEGPLVQHVDLVPTIRDLFDALDSAEITHDGRSLHRPIEHDRPAYTNGVVPLPPDRRFGGTRLDPIYEAPSVWTADGGYVFPQTRLPKRLLTGVYQSLRCTNTTSYNAESSGLEILTRLLPKYVPSSQSYGSPELAKTEAKRFCEDVLTQQITVDQETLTDETRETLADLGYV